VDAVLTVTAPTAVSDPGAGVVAGVVAGGGGTPVIDVQLARPTTLERLAMPGAPAGDFLVSVDDPGTAARALGLAARRALWLARRSSVPVIPAGVDTRAAHDLVRTALARDPDGTWLRPPEVESLCRAAGLPTVPAAWVTTGRDAAAAAARTGGPVAVKGSVVGVVHKGDAGFLRLPVTDPAEAGRVVDEWAARAGARWLGALVQPLVPPGDEYLVGAVRDASAGPVVAFGPGGRAVDALGHRVHRLAPLTESDVEELLAGTGMLATAHGRSLDAEGMADCLRRVGWLADAVPEIAEVEINPLVVTPEGCTALDVRVRLQRATRP
jgi:hypothetical protein